MPKKQQEIHETESIPWIPVEGIPGMFEKVLNVDPDTGSVSRLLRFEPGTRTKEVLVHDFIEEIYIIHDGEELFWRLDRETWLTRDQAEDTWIGANSISLPAGTILPGGEYRVLLIDAAGESDETSFILKPLSPVDPRRLLPAVTVDTDTISVAGSRQSYSIWLYNPAGEYLAALALEQKRFSIRQILGVYPALASGFHFRIHSGGEGEQLGVVSGPYYVQP